MQLLIDAIQETILLCAALYMNCEPYIFIVSRSSQHLPTSCVYCAFQFPRNNRRTSLPKNIPQGYVNFAMYIQIRRWQECPVPSIQIQQRVSFHKEIHADHSSTSIQTQLALHDRNKPIEALTPAYAYYTLPRHCQRPDNKYSACNTSSHISNKSPRCLAQSDTADTLRLYYSALQTSCRAPGAAWATDRSRGTPASHRN